MKITERNTLKIIVRPKYTKIFYFLNRVLLFYNKAVRREKSGLIIENNMQV